MNKSPRKISTKKAILLMMIFGFVSQFISYSLDYFSNNSFTFRDILVSFFVVIILSIPIGLIFKFFYNEENNPFSKIEK